MSARTLLIAGALLAVAFVAPSASAHESYELGDGEYTLTVGDQNEPMYTWKWTNLDLIIRDSAGDPVALSEEELAALDARLEAPGGQFLNGTLEGQFGEEGRYEFGNGHFYTQPGQYTLHLDGQIKGVDATGEYDLPGPRQAGESFAFPHEDVPTVLDLDDRVQALEGEQDDQQLQQKVQELESKVSTLEQKLQTLREDQRKLEEQQKDAPGLGVAGAVAAIAAVALVGARRQR